jgi:hypothetical protein
MFTCDVDPPREDSLRCAEILSHLVGPFDTNDELLWLAAMLSPFRGLVCKTKKKEVPAVSVVLSDGLKVSTRTVSS